MHIQDDNTFQAALRKLGGKEQRVAAARFVENVLPLTNDTKLAQVVEIATNDNASCEDLAAALRIAQHSALENRARYGIEGDWHKQAGYFVARAAVAALSPRCQVPEGIAWHAALNSRLARTSEAIDNGVDTEGQEREKQYLILTGFLTQQHQDQNL